MYLLRGDSILLDKVRDQVVNPLSLFLHGQCLVNMHSLPKHVPCSSNMSSLCTKIDWSLVVSDYACKLTSLKAWLDIIMRSLLLILAFY